MHLPPGSKTRMGLAAALVLALAAWGTLALKNRLATRALMRETPDEAATNLETMRFARGEGAPLFRGHCAGCHGVGGKGDHATGVPDLTDNDWLYGMGRASDVEKVVYYGIRSHNPRGWSLTVMPGFARPVPSATEHIPPMTPAGIRAVIAYLLTLEGRPADTVLAAEGNKLYHGNGGCYDCHTADARGDSAIGAPDLTDRVWLYGDGSPGAMFESIAYGRQGVCPAWSDKLSPAEMREVSLYVYSLSRPQK